MKNPQATVTACDSSSMAKGLNVYHSTLIYYVVELSQFRNNLFKYVLRDLKFDECLSSKQRPQPKAAFLFLNSLPFIFRMRTVG